MTQQEKAGYSADSLQREFRGFRVTRSPSVPHFSFDRLLAEVTLCDKVKDRVVRQVYYLEAPYGQFFLKRSTVVRTKDRLRHFFLPRRRWAEWRHLCRLRVRGVAVPEALCRGEKGGFIPDQFFLLTRRVAGEPLSCHSLEETKKLGGYVAFLHSCGVYHADLHPENVIMQEDGTPCLIDVQEVFFLRLLPKWLRIHNLGKLWFHLRVQTHPQGCLATFLTGYNEGRKKPVKTSEVMKAADRHQQRHYYSRAKRCCKNSTEFTVIKEKGFSGYKRRDFPWDLEELWKGLKNGTTLKPGKVITFKGVCIKGHRRRFLHCDRCLRSWKMSRALEVRGIPVPRALGYFRIGERSYFLAEFIVDSQPLNEYLSSLELERQKRDSLKKLALWLRSIHDRNIWQRDFKSSNILCKRKAYIMVDLDGVRICRHLPYEKKILNLAQLNASLSNAITIKDRLRFFFYYSKAETALRDKRRAIYQRIWNITLEKNTALFGLDLTKLKL